MKKVIFECIGNSILFILMGLLLIFPFSSFKADDSGFEVTLSIFPLIFFGYFILFLVIRFFILHDGKKSNFSVSELTFSDEREKIIVAESTKFSYQVMITGLIVSAAVLSGIQAFSHIFSNNNFISSYSAGIALIVLNLVLGVLSYALKWCIEYQK